MGFFTGYSLAKANVGEKIDGGLSSHCWKNRRVTGEMLDFHEVIGGLEFFGLKILKIFEKIHVPWLL